MDMPVEDRCKVGRVAAEYGLSDIHTELKTRREEDGESLRGLAEFFNTRILDAALGDIGVNVIGDPQSIYQLLTDDDSPPEQKAAVRDQLEFNDVDLESLERDFVSHELVRKHLNECLDIETSRDGVDSITEARQLINSVQERERTILERTLRRLKQKNILEIGAFDMTYTTRITCNECGQSYTLDALLDQGGCECVDDL